MPDTNLLALLTLVSTFWAGVLTVQKLKKTFKFCQTGEILPNLATLQADQDNCWSIGLDVYDAESPYQGGTVDSWYYTKTLSDTQHNYDQNNIVFVIFGQIAYAINLSNVFVG